MLLALGDFGNSQVNSTMANANPPIMAVMKPSLKQVRRRKKNKESHSQNVHRDVLCIACVENGANKNKFKQSNMDRSISYVKQNIIGICDTIVQSIDAILFGPELLDVNKVFSWHKQCARGLAIMKENNDQNVQALQDFGISKGELKVLLKKYNTMDDGDQIEYAECERQYGI